MRKDNKQYMTKITEL